jgi:hypothetical protein
MLDMEPINHLQTIELLKAAKPLFASGDAYLVAGAGALSAVAGVLVAYLTNRWTVSGQRETTRKSTAFQIYAEISATLEVEQYRGYSTSIRDLLKASEGQDDFKGIYQVQVPDERFIIFKANLANLGLLPPKLQSDIVLLYQLLEAVVQDIKPGGLLNLEHVGREPFVELLCLMDKSRRIAYEILAQIEKLYPDVA